MVREKVYIVKTKEGAHINKKMKADGSRAALQFDSENSLLGPVDLIEVDESQYMYREPVYHDRSLGQKIIEDVIIPAASDALADLAHRAADALGDWALEKGLPAAKVKGAKLFNMICDVFVPVKPVRSVMKQEAAAVKQSTKVVESIVEQDGRTVVHNQEEVEQILNNMKYAALYIAAGIRELSNTVIQDDGTDPQKVLLMQQKLNELSSKEVMDTIGFMLEDKNRDALDQVTIQLFEAFRQKEFIVDGEAVPISRYLRLAS